MNNHIVLNNVIVSLENILSAELYSSDEEIHIIYNLEGKTVPLIIHYDNVEIDINAKEQKIEKEYRNLKEYLEGEKVYTEKDFDYYLDLKYRSIVADKNHLESYNHFLNDELNELKEKIGIDYLRENIKLEKEIDSLNDSNKKLDQQLNKLKSIPVLGKILRKVAESDDN